MIKSVVSAASNREVFIYILYIITKRSNWYKKSDGMRLHVFVKSIKCIHSRKFDKIILQLQLLGKETKIAILQTNIIYSYWLLVAFEWVNMYNEINSKYETIHILAISWKCQPEKSTEMFNRCLNQYNHLMHFVCDLSQCFILFI